MLGHDCHSTVGGGFSDILTKMSWFHRRKEDLSDFFEYPEHVNRRLPKDVKLIMIEHAEFYCKVCWSRCCGRAACANLT